MVMVQTTAPSVSNGGSKKSKKSKRNSDGEGSAEKEKKKKKKEKKKKKVRALSGTYKKENILIIVCFLIEISWKRLNEQRRRYYPI